ncbi:MAG TPA: carboxypeptidase-like regulatory domain-containing protein [Vicinamibacterales bacterium]|jgi:hypothetical protein|nr:carboxypeptidase-like regulatory domain-containing protein [Vicinamibacterales bacterium]
MRRLVLFLFLTSLFLTSAIACHPGQPLAGGVKRPAGGTISGTVSASDKSVALPGRKVTLTELTTNARYDTTTAANGGYTIQVPEGTYRIQLELRAGESLEKHPADTRVHRSDIDAGRDFVVTVKP